MKRYTPLRRIGLKKTRRLYELEDLKYLRWLRGQSCAIPGCSAAIVEAAHIGPRGYGSRCADREAIPLCPGHHRTRRDAQHVLGKLFWAHHGLDRWDLIRRYQSLYAVEHGR